MQIIIILILAIIPIAYKIRKDGMFAFLRDVVGIDPILFAAWGANSSTVLTQFSSMLAVWFNTLPLEAVSVRYKETLNKLGSKHFNAFKMMGIRPTRRAQNKASRGYDKLRDILMITKLNLKGNVLSLCCGRGGWEQVIAKMPGVSKIQSFTFGQDAGHRGHENFTEKSFPGREKIKLTYGDCRNLNRIAADVILFDGGESNSSLAKENEKFYQLFREAVMPHISGPHQDFILKVLTPSYPPMIKLLQEIQFITGKGSLVRSTHSRNSTLEMYMVSTVKHDLVRDVRVQMSHNFLRAAQGVQLSGRDYMGDEKFERPKILPKKFQILEPLNMSKSIKALGNRLDEAGREFSHWESLGVYPYGYAGASSTSKPEVSSILTNGLKKSMPGLLDWLATDTTPSGFTKTFMKKIDVAPEENPEYIEELEIIYRAKARYYKSRGYVYRELTWEEVYDLANKQGAAHFVDIEYESIKDFFKNPDWVRECEKVMEELLNGTPINGIFSAIGKREKKSSPHGPAGSRMVAFLPIATRLCELKIFGNLNQITKPDMNHFAVGGIGLHDLGMRIEEVWRGCGESSDIASYDTRIGLTVLSLESLFHEELGLGKVAKMFYRLYSYPFILIPMPAAGYVRSELIEGRGQRMSGTRVTYDMNTETRNNLNILRLSIAFGISKEALAQFVHEIMKRDNKYNIGGCTSGDDEFITSDHSTMLKYNATSYILHQIGFPRKNIPANIKGVLCRKIEEIEFCSHNYHRVTYYQESTGRIAHRYMPTRNAAEIIAKSTIRLGGDSAGLMGDAWVSAQGNNLLVNYHHLRTCRSVGLAFKAVPNPKLILTGEGSEYVVKPWMREGQILDVINTLLFGESTKYPLEGFYVEKIGHLGYLKPRAELIYDPEGFTTHRSNWRNNLIHLCQQLIDVRGTGGDITIFGTWRQTLTTL